MLYNDVHFSKTKTFVNHQMTQLTINVKLMLLNQKKKKAEKNEEAKTIQDLSFNKHTSYKLTYVKNQN